jgi:tRNA(adenine34) deaminase
MSSSPQDDASAGGADAADERPDTADGGESRRADLHFMGLALEQARAAAADGEVPIGALVVLGGAVLAADHNRTRTLGDPTAHAEILALRRACHVRGEARLPEATVYTTVEPCFMCAGALSQARVARVVFGVRDPKFGGAVSLGAVLTDPRTNHRARLTEGVGAAEAAELLQQFFRELRPGLKQRRRARRRGSAAGADDPSGGDVQRPSAGDSKGLGSDRAPSGS